MTREAREPATIGWQDNYNNKSLSGIEVCDRDGKLMNFINIRHDEILKNKPPHRIQIKLNENAEPILPPPQTFDEIIQAKRRHQMLLYGSGSSSSSSSAPTATSMITPAPATRAPAATTTTRAPVAAISTPAPTTASNRSPAPAPTGSSSAAARAATAAASTLAPKDIKAMLKFTPPGHSIILPDGTVIKKSRRGGARAGAGRKRSRPLPGAPPSTSSASAFDVSTK